MRFKKFSEHSPARALKGSDGRCRALRGLIMLQASLHGELVSCEQPSTHGAFRQEGGGEPPRRLLSLPSPAYTSPIIVEDGSAAEGQTGEEERRHGGQALRLCWPL